MASRKPSIPRMPVAARPPVMEGPPRRETMEVEASWLEQVDEDPGPKRRETMEVQLEWLEADEAPRRASARAMPAARPSRTARAVPPPLPPAPDEGHTGRVRAAWEPPPLPPPPAKATSSR